jgi:hypothetical protein
LVRTSRDFGSDFVLTQNDTKSTHEGGSYAFDNDSSSGTYRKCTLDSGQWQDAFYRFKRTSTNQTFDVKTWSADYWDSNNSGSDSFQGMMIDIMPGADQFTHQTDGDGGGGDHQAGASVSETPTLWAKADCSTHPNYRYCVYIQRKRTLIRRATHSLPMNPKYGQARLRG